MSKTRKPPSKTKSPSGTKSRKAKKKTSVTAITEVSIAAPVPTAAPMQRSLPPTPLEVQVGEPTSRPPETRFSIEAGVRMTFSGALKLAGVMAFLKAFWPQLFGD